MKTWKLIAVLLLAGLTALALSCGDDDASAPAATSATAAANGGQTSEPTATTEADDREAGNGGSAPAADAVGSVTVGDETWNIVASGECDFDSETAPNLTLINISGHAAEDDSIAISIAFDPRDTGLTLTVEGAGGDPSWTALNETFVVRAGSSTVGGEGSFMGGGETVEGSFEARC